MEIEHVPDVKEPCCSGAAAESAICCSIERALSYDRPWLDGVIFHSSGVIPRVKTDLTRADIAGGWKARWGINRMKYSVPPELYAVGDPTPESPVFVTANYKLTFDLLRTTLKGRDVWILALDTKGINVWCAAGKGTFGTDELVRRLDAVKLPLIVSHRTLILPQLGATGVSAFAVKRRTGYTVKFGPVRADDLPAFIDNGMAAMDEMRRVRFPLWDRFVLIPLELVSILKYSLPAMILVMLLSGIGKWGVSADKMIVDGFQFALLLFFGSVAGAVMTPVLLPWLPGRMFSVKGISVGILLMFGVRLFSVYVPTVFSAGLPFWSWAMIVAGLTGFVGMNFTGASTYTSLSGVQKELRLFLPIHIMLVAAGTIVWIVSRFL